MTRTLFSVLTLAAALAALSLTTVPSFAEDAPKTPPKATTLTLPDQGKNLEPEDRMGKFEIQTLMNQSTPDGNTSISGGSATR